MRPLAKLWPLRAGSAANPARTPKTQQPIDYFLPDDDAKLELDVDARRHKEN